MAIDTTVLVRNITRLSTRFAQSKLDLSALRTLYTDLLSASQVKDGTIAQLVADKAIDAAALLEAGTAKEALLTQLASITAQAVQLASNDAADAQTIADLQAAVNVNAQSLANAGIEKAELEARLEQKEADAVATALERDTAVSDANAARLEVERLVSEEAAEDAADAAAQAAIDALAASAGAEAGEEPA